MKRFGFDMGSGHGVGESQSVLRNMRGISSYILCFLIVSLLFQSSYGKEYVLKLSFPSSVPEKPQKPRIDFQTLVENTQVPIELRNFRIKEEAEREKKLVLKGLPRHILESKRPGFNSFMEKRPLGLKVKMDFFPQRVINSENNLNGSYFTLGVKDEDTKLNIFSGFANLPAPSSIIGGSLEREYGLNTFYLSLAHRKILLTGKPSGFYSLSVFTDLGILSNLNLLFDIDYLHFYDSKKTFDHLNPKIEISFRPSSSWLFKSELSCSFHRPLMEIGDDLLFMPSSSIYIVQPINSSALSLSIFKYLFSDFSIGIKLCYEDIEEVSSNYQNLNKDFWIPIPDKGSSFKSLLILSREKGSGIKFSLSSGVLIPSISLSPNNLPLRETNSPSPLIFTFSSLIKGELEISGTSFEIGYNWASFPYISLSLKDIYSSKIVVEQELPILKFIGGNIAIVVEFRNFLNFLKPPVIDRYLLILYPQWIRGGLEIEF